MPAPAAQEPAAAAPAPAPSTDGPPSKPVATGGPHMHVTSFGRTRPSRAAWRISPPPAVRPLSVLVVDDGNRQGLVQLLRSALGEQTQIHECDSGLAALEILRRGRIDVVLVDYLLPDMNGLELVSAVAEMA